MPKLSIDTFEKLHKFENKTNEKCKCMVYVKRSFNFFYGELKGVDITGRGVCFVPRVLFLA